MTHPVLALGPRLVQLLFSLRTCSPTTTCAPFFPERHVSPGQARSTFVDLVIAGDDLGRVAPLRHRRMLRTRCTLLEQDSLHMRLCEIWVVHNRLLIVLTFRLCVLCGPGMHRLLAMCVSGMKSFEGALRVPPLARPTKFLHELKCY